MTVPGQDRAGIQTKAERMSGWRRAGLVRGGARETQYTTQGSDDSAHWGPDPVSIIGSQLLRAPLSSAKC